MKQRSLDARAYESEHKLPQIVGELYKEVYNGLLHLNDQAINCRLKKMQFDTLDPMQQLMNVRTFFQMLLNDRQNLEDILMQHNESGQNDYEKQLQKLEAEIRQHIRVEQQLKLYAETTQAKLDDCTKQRETLEQHFQQTQEELKRSSEQNRKLVQQVAQLEREMRNLRQPQQHQAQAQKPLSQSKNIKPNIYRVQTEPTEENIMSMSNSVQKTQVIAEKKRVPSKRSLDTNLQRNGSNKSYAEASYLSKSRQKSLSKYSQNSIDDSTTRIKQKNNSLCSGDYSHPSFRPFSSMENPLQDMESVINANGRVSCQEYYECSQQLKNLLYRKQNENYPPNKMVDRRRR